MHPIGLQINDNFGQPKVVANARIVNFNLSVGSFHMKFVPNKYVVINVTNVTSPRKVTNANQKKEKGEPNAKLLSANKALFKGSYVVTNQKDDKDGDGDHEKPKQTLEPSKGKEEEEEEEEEEKKEEGEEVNVETNAPPSKKKKFVALGKQTKHANGKSKAQNLHHC